MSTDDSLPDDVATLKAMLAAHERAGDGNGGAERGAIPRGADREAEVHDRQAAARAVRPISERGALLEQLELQLPIWKRMPRRPRRRHRSRQPRRAQTVKVPAFERRKPARRPLPEHLPRERIVYPPPAACPCCGGATLRKLGEDVTETLELIPRQWKVIQHVREKFSCRACEAITQPPAPSHPIARGRAGPGLLGAHPVRQVRPASAAQPPERDLCARGHRARRVDAGRLGRRRGGNADAAGRGDPRPCLRGRAHPCRRHDRAGAGQGQDPHRPTMDLCARRPAVRRAAIRRPRSSSTRPTAAASIPSSIWRATPG